MQAIREFKIREIRYVNYRVAVGLLAGHGFLSQTRQSTLPSFAFSWFRECAF